MRKEITVENEKETGTELIRELKKAFKGLKTSFNKGYFYVSGFVEREDGQIIYFSTADYRDRDWIGKTLYRTAKDFKDFTGGRNNFCHFSDLKEKIDCIKG